MTLYLDTSTPTCKIWLDNHLFEYQTDRNLARDLLGLILESIELASSEQSLQNSLQTLRSLTAIAIFKGPGSFTGLRIGATVANTLADQLSIPIVGTTTPNWRQLAKDRLSKNENDQIILPEYGKPANITTPRK